jgi:cell division protein FtsX
MRARLNFYLSEALRSLSTNKATSIAAVIAMIVALLIVGLTAVGLQKARATGANIQEQASTVNVYLEETATGAQVNNLRADLERFGLLDGQIQIVGSLAQGVTRFLGR